MLVTLNAFLVSIDQLIQFSLLKKKSVTDKIAVDLHQNSDDIQSNNSNNSSEVDN